HRLVSRLYPPKHGSTHRADGSDPIPGLGGGGGGIQFDTEPQSGDWLDVETTSTDGNGYGATFTDSGGGGWTFLTIHGGANLASAGFYFATGPGADDGLNTVYVSGTNTNATATAFEADQVSSGTGVTKAIIGGATSGGSGAANGVTGT